MIDLQATAPRHKTSFLRRASLAALEHLTFLDDATYLKMRYALKMGKRLDLDDPKTFNEKLQWLKLHDRNPLYTTLVDKAAVKPWVAERIGWEHVVPTLGVWDSFDKIDFDELPERFVLKCTHDSGGLAICRDRATFDMDAARKKIEKSLRRNYYFHGREWPYKDVCPRVLAEEYLDSPATSEITDYKLMCFNGRARCAFTCTGRAGGDLRVDFFDLDWNRLPFTRHYSASDVPPEAPLRLHEMVGISERLAKGMPFVRVDFYEVAGETYFGELTFYPGNGMEEFDPEQWDEELGSWVTLPNTFGGGVCFSWPMMPCFGFTAWMSPQLPWGQLVWWTTSSTASAASRASSTFRRVSRTTLRPASASSLLAGTSSLTVVATMRHSRSCRRNRAPSARCFDLPNSSQRASRSSGLTFTTARGGRCSPS